MWWNPYASTLLRPPLLFNYPRRERSRTGGHVRAPVCTENLVRVDPMRESLNVGHDGRADISLRELGCLDIFHDYRTNLPLYPAIQAYFRKHQPPTLIVWGKNDKIFPADGAYPFKRDLPKVEFHLIDTGHFALEDKADEMARSSTGKPRCAGRSSRQTRAGTERRPRP
jgi:pimeloyl-ACP methyl ester carboxylesterase